MKRRKKGPAAVAEMVTQFNPTAAQQLWDMFRAASAPGGPSGKWLARTAGASAAVAAAANPAQQQASLAAEIDLTLAAEADEIERERQELADAA